MKTMLTVMTAVALASVVPTLGDFGAVRASHNQQLFLTESNGSSPGSRDTAMFAETESNGPTSGGRDAGTLADSESNRPSPGGRDSAQA